MNTTETTLETGETSPGTLTETARDSFDLSVCELKKKRLSVRAIARQLGCSPAKVHRSISRTIDQFVDNMGLQSLSREEIQCKIFGFAPKAVQQIQRLATLARKEEVQLKASADMLDRAGFAPVQKSLIGITAVEEMSREELIAEINRMIDTRLDQNEQIQQTDGI